MRVGIDIGGTFTDCMFVDDRGEITIAKTPSTPRDFAEGLFRVIDKLTLDITKLEEFTHGTTAALNAVLQRKVARTGLITTRGYRDVLEIMRGARPDMYNLQQEKPIPFVPRRMRLEVGERLNFRGEVLTPLDEDSVTGALKDLKGLGVESIAVCLLHAYADPSHEQRIKEMIEENDGTVHVSISAEISPEWREFERTSTTVLNACTAPIMVRYLTELERRLRSGGYGREPMIMQSNGGLMTARTARKVPVKTLFSGPAAGVMGSCYLAKTVGLSNVITYDMGGTTCIVGLVDDGRIRTKSQGMIDGWPIMAPMIDTTAIGAGGGSIAWIDSGGGLRVGPQSAQADPGPVCYAMGGTEPTVTDAQVVMGRINPAYFLGGEMKLDVDGAEKAVKTRIAEYFGFDAMKAASSIIQILVANQSRLTRTVSVERGYDPRDFTLVGFGGAGGLHASLVAAELGIPRVMICFAPGHMSCLGQMVADVRHDFVQTYVRSQEALVLDEANGLLVRLEREGIERLRNESIPEDRMSLTRSADIRYLGQEYTVEVPLPGGRLSERDVDRARTTFNDLYELSYHYSMRNEPIEFVNLRMVAVGATAKPLFRKYLPGDGRAERALKGRRMVFFDEAGGLVSCPTYEWTKLQPRCVVEGPAIIEEPGSTVAVYPGQRATVDEYLDVIIDVSGGELPS